MSPIKGAIDTFQQLERYKSAAHEAKVEIRDEQNTTRAGRNKNALFIAILETQGAKLASGTGDFAQTAKDVWRS